MVKLVLDVKIALYILGFVFTSLWLTVPLSANAGQPANTGAPATIEQTGNAADQGSSGTREQMASLQAGIDLQRQEIDQISREMENAENEALEVENTFAVSIEAGLVAFDPRDGMEQPAFDGRVPDMVRGGPGGHDRPDRIAQAQAVFYHGPVDYFCRRTCFAFGRH